MFIKTKNPNKKMVRKEIRPTPQNAPKPLQATTSRYYGPTIVEKAVRSFIAAEKERQQAEKPNVYFSKQFVRVPKRELMHRKSGWTDKSITNRKKIIAGSVVNFNKKAIKLELKPEVSRSIGPYIKGDNNKLPYLFN
jgi:hypothetical protein